MTSDGDDFWRKLQQQLHEESRELAEIERQLGSVEESPLSDDQIEGMVEHALSDSGSSRVYRNTRFGRFGPPLAAAAALLLTPKVVIAATAVTAVAAATYVLWPSGANSRENLPFGDAVEVMMQTSRLEEARLSASLRLSGDVLHTSHVI